MPGGACPWCKEIIKVERRGKQNCRQCGGRLNVEITDNPIKLGDNGNGFNTRTYIRKG